MTSLLEKSHGPLSLGGALLILLFLFLPMTPMNSIVPDQSTYYLFGHGAQHGTLLLLPLTLVLIYYRVLWGAMLTLVGLFLCMASAFMGHILTPYWGSITPGFGHAISMFVGLILIALSIFGSWLISASGSRITIRVGDSKNTTSALKAENHKTGSISGGIPTLGDMVNTIDWGWWGTLLLSFIVWPLGLLLHFAFARSNDDKADAAMIGAGLGLGVMVLRFVLAMAKVGAGA